MILDVGDGSHTLASMKWPPSLPEELGCAVASLTRFAADDAPGLFTALEDELAWEHIPRQIPTTADELGAALAARIATGTRMTFTISCDDVIVGTTSVIFDSVDPPGVEIGATQLNPAIWGSGVNDAAKALLVEACFAAGATWIQFRTDERNQRSAAAIRKLGARDLGIRQDTRTRRDGTIRRSRFFRLDPPGSLGADYLPSEARVVSAERIVEAGPEVLFELIADPGAQPRWDGNDNLREAPPGQRVHGNGDVFLMTRTKGSLRENHVVEFEEGRRIAWRPSEPGSEAPGHLWRWELKPLSPTRTMVRHTYDWTELTDPLRLPRARATTPERLQASIERLATIAEASQRKR